MKLALKIALWWAPVLYLKGVAGTSRSLAGGVGFFPAHQISETSGGLADGFPGKHAATPSEGRTTTSAIQGHRRLPQCIDGAVEHRERRALKKRRSEPARLEVDFFFCGGESEPVFCGW